MKVLFLCGIFGKENTEYIVQNAKRPVEYSADIFQEKLLNGFNSLRINVKVLSAPFVGSFPNASKILKFKSKGEGTADCKFVSFNNIWGIRNFSRANALKKEIENFISLKDDEKYIIVYSPHTPFMEAASYAKSRDDKIKICLIVPDLPQYMNLDAHISLAYRIGKKYDIYRFNKLNKKVDAFVLLTEHMKESLLVNNRKYMVVEGIIDIAAFSLVREIRRKVNNEDGIRYIVYTGKLNERFGIKNLVDAFSTLQNDKLRLVLCGKGDMELYINEMVKQDSRIMYLGQISPEEAKEWVYRADVLVNPRKNDEEYTKYSFPSKNIEYLMTGNPVVAYMLDGMPQQYKEFLHIVQDNNLAEAIQYALKFSDNHSFYTYAENNLSNEKVAERMIDMMQND